MSMPVIECELTDKNELSICTHNVFRIMRDQYSAIEAKYSHIIVSYSFIANETAVWFAGYDKRLDDNIHSDNVFECHGKATAAEIVIAIAENHNIAIKLNSPLDFHNANAAKITPSTTTNQ